MMISIILWISFLSIWIAAEVGDTNGGFVVPPPASSSTTSFDENVVYDVGDTMNIQWETDWTTIALSLVHVDSKLQSCIQGQSHC